MKKSGEARKRSSSFLRQKHRARRRRFAAAVNSWIYLCVFLDAYSRKVVGYSIDESMETRMVNEALSMAFRRRDPRDKLIIHSDQGVQYASHEFRAFLATRNIVQSMSRKGDCWDNSMAESFFSSPKKELIHRQAWISKKQATDAISEWIEL